MNTHFVLKPQPDGSWVIIAYIPTGEKLQKVKISCINHDAVLQYLSMVLGAHPICFDEAA